MHYSHTFMTPKISIPMLYLKSHPLTFRSSVHNQPSKEGHSFAEVYTMKYHFHIPMHKRNIFQHQQYVFQFVQKESQTQTKI